MTEFGLLLSELMRVRGITEPRELSVRLIEAGYWFTGDTVRDYMSSAVEQPDPAFGRGVAEVLGLDEEEKTKLARNFLFGHRLRPRCEEGGNEAASC
jgi:hypothetical protein